MALERNHKFIIAILAIIALLVAAYFIYKAIPKSPGGGVPVDSKTITPGLLDSINWGWLKNIFNKNPKTDPCANVTCDPLRSGWDIDGFPNNCCS